MLTASAFTSPPPPISLLKAAGAGGLASTAWRSTLAARLSMSKVCVLIAEDHEDILDVLQTVLVCEGFYVATACDGKKALALLQQFRPGVILTDLMMPHVTGIELVRYVRRTPELATIPVIVMSAARSGSLQEAKDAGANETIRKPLDLDFVVNLLHKYLPDRAPMGGPG